MRITRNVRPFRVTIVSLLFFCTACWNGYRLLEAINFWHTLRNYGASPLYIAISGGFWLLIGLLCAWWLWAGKPWARLSTLAGLFGYTVWYWLDRLFVQESHLNWPFATAINIILITVFISFLLSDKSKRFFLRIPNER
jgi:hypothetical protein